MTSISGIQSGSSLTGYLESTSNKDLDAKTIFKKLSIDVGGDSKEITKTQLDSYIAEADKKIAAKEETSISDEELTSLKKMQKDWDKISMGSDSISYANMSGRKDILTSMDTEDETPAVNLRKDAATATANAYGYIMESALSFSPDKNDPTSGLTSMLNTLLTGTTDEDDDANADLIDQLTNMIAKYKDITSTIEVEA